MDDWVKVVIGAGVGGALTVLAAVATAWFGFASKDEELKVRLVEIAIGILRADPKEDVAPARAWAIDVIEKNSGVLFTPEDRLALLHKPIAVWGESSWGQSSWGQEPAPPPTAPSKGP